MEELSLETSNQSPEPQTSPGSFTNTISGFPSINLHVPSITHPGITCCKTFMPHLHCLLGIYCLKGQCPLKQPDRTNWTSLITAIFVLLTTTWSCICQSKSPVTTCTFSGVTWWPEKIVRVDSASHKLLVESFLDLYSPLKSKTHACVDVFLTYLLPIIFVKLFPLQVGQVYQYGFDSGLSPEQFKAGCDVISPDDSFSWKPTFILGWG